MKKVTLRKPFKPVHTSAALVTSTQTAVTGLQSSTQGLFLLPENIVIFSDSDIFIACISMTVMNSAFVTGV
jgi:hypothetical protein